jgi:hypothetical protein
LRSTCGAPASTTGIRREGTRHRNSFRAKLTGYQEVPAINTAGQGSLTASLNSAGTVLTYTLTYTGLSGPAGAAHIHFAQPGVNGGVVLWLCGGGGKPACPAAGVPITGTVNAGDVSALPGVAAQGMGAGDLTLVLKAMRAGVTYANVHTAAFPGGEIRGQINGRGKSGND